MRRSLRQQIPSMFERRLLLLVAACVGVGALLIGRTAQLTLGEEHARLSREAELALRQTTYIPTIRGRILDRNGNVLAENRPGYDVAVSFSVLTGEWAMDMAAIQARREHSAIWSELSPDDRAAIIDGQAGPYRQQIDELFRTLGELGRVEQAQLDKRRNAIIAEVQQTAAEATLRKMQERLRELDEPISWAEANTKVREQDLKHSVLRDVDEQVRLFVEGSIADAERALAAREADPKDKAAQQQSDALAVWRQVQITRPKHRRYPYETVNQVAVDMSTMPPDLRSDSPVVVDVTGVALPIIGRMRDVYAEDMQANPFYYTKDGQTLVNPIGYLAGDRAGSTGIESSMETALRGSRGQSIRRRDTGSEQRTEPIPGHDVKLSIDINLQAKLQALLSPEVGLTLAQPYHHPNPTPRDVERLGTPLNGGAVILQVDTGEVLAAASFPSYSMQQLEEDPDSIFKDPVRLPYIFRPTNLYNPGSTIKPVMLVSAVSAGKYNLSDFIVCDGMLDHNHPDRWRCWIFKTYQLNHGMEHGAEAIKDSCNVFFYTLGQRMGPERTIDWYSRWGLGKPTGCGIEESSGSLPDPARADLADAINMGIGQGPVRWTPLQAAAAYAALARGGVYLPPTFVQNTSQPRPRTDLHVDSSAVAEAMQGLYDVVNYRGTGSDTDFDGTAYWLDRTAGERVINATGVKVYGKSGTADVPRSIDRNGNGKSDPGEFEPADEVDDHAWFVCLVRPENEPGPYYAIAVFTEYAGSGGKVSGPIANQIIHLLQQEGWL